MKFLLLVADGMGDRGFKTPLGIANKPNMSRLAKNGKVGLIDIGYKKTVNSDFGYLNLLGCYHPKEYPGRGYLEALGIGLNPGPHDICLRCNWATLDKNGNILDRRAGREEKGLVELAELFDGMVMEDVRFSVKPSTGHRLVLVLHGEGLSDQIIPNDPLKERVALPEVKAKNKGAKLTAHVLNRFLREATNVLEDHHINRERVFPANAILIRNAGKEKHTRSFVERFGLKACCIAGIPIAKGVSRFLGIDVIEVKGATGKPHTNLKGKFEAAAKALKNYDLVFLHINATDIYSHDGRPFEKAKYIEKIDAELGALIRKTDLKKTVIAVTCDHRTVSAPDFRQYRHVTDPVPVLVSGGGVKPDKIETFDEASAERGSIRLKGGGLIPYLKRISK